MRPRRLARFWAGMSLLAFAGVASAADPPALVAKSEARTPADERKAFHLPEGFEIQLVAAEPEIHKPLNIAFWLDQGRLWVTDTLEYPFPVPVGQPGRDGVKLLSDFGPDGKARKVETFTTGLNIPIGVLPLPGRDEALVHSIPYVYTMSRDGKKEPLYKSYGHRDTHGMTNNFTWGFDGWIYACHGFSNESTVQGSDQQPITMQSGNVYRMKADGSHLEYVTHGQVNPFGLAFDSLGNLYSCDCHSRPVYQLLRGAWYPSFGKPHDGLGFGPEMCGHDHGSTAISGIVYYAAEAFPKAFRENVFIGNPVTNRINRDTLQWHGTTPNAIEQPDFLVSDDPWFRPVDLVLGPDGAMYVADFYNRIIGHYEVPLTHPGRDRERGRIWRIVYTERDAKVTGYAAKNDANGRPPTVRKLIEDLGDPNLSVRTRAANRLLEEPNPMQAVALLDQVVNRQGAEKEVDNPWRRVHALWVLHRFGAVTDKTLAHAAADPDRAVRTHAMRTIAERGGARGPRGDFENPAVKLARKGLSDTDPHVRRAAADALGRHPETGNIKPLLTLRESTASDDTHLIHVVRMALRDQLRDEAAWGWVNAQSLSDRERAEIADVAAGVPSVASADYLMDQLKQHTESRGNMARYVHHVARYGQASTEPALLRLLQDPKTQATGGLEGQATLLKEFQQGRQERSAPLNEDQRQYAAGVIGALLDSPRSNEVAEGIALAGSFKFAAVRDRLTALAANSKATDRYRTEALAAVAAIDPKAAVPLLGKALGETEAPIAVRERAAALLSSGNQAEGQAELLKVLPTAPERIQRAIAAALAARQPGAEALLNAIAAGKASARLLQDNRVANLLNNAKVPNLSDRLATLLRGLPPADARLNELIASRRRGFASAIKGQPCALGSKVFETQCASCHQIAGKGAKIGPQLDGVGLRGLERILEDLLDPSRNVDQMFRASSLALKDGRVVSGLLLNDDGAVFVIADAQGKEIRVPKDTVEERAVSPLSPMPANFTDQITEADFYRLVAYLLSQRPAQ